MGTAATSVTAWARYTNALEKREEELRATIANLHSTIGILRAGGQPVAIGDLARLAQRVSMAAQGMLSTLRAQAMAVERDSHSTKTNARQFKQT